MVGGNGLGTMAAACEVFCTVRPLYGSTPVRFDPCTVRSILRFPTSPFVHQPLRSPDMRFAMKLTHLDHPVLSRPLCLDGVIRDGAGRFRQAQKTLRSQPRTVR